MTPSAPTAPTATNPALDPTAPATPDPVGTLTAPVRLRADHLTPGDVLGAVRATPSLSWEVPTAPAGWTQTSAEIELTRGTVGGPTTTSTVRTTGATSTFLPWPATPLTSRERVTWRVRVTGTAADGAATTSPWSAPALIETGLLDRTDWTARPVTPAAAVTRTDPAPVLVRRFTVDDGGVGAARLHLTAGGIYEAYLDGVKVGTDELAPGWTEYRERFVVSTHDVTAALTPGEHELAVVLGNGWYRGQLTWECRTEIYGDRLWLLAQLEMSGAPDGDGAGAPDPATSIAPPTTVIATDADWTWRASNVTANDLYDGQHTDLRLPALGDPAAEAGVQVLDLPDAALVPATLPLPTVIGELGPVEVITTPSGRRVLDLGQNVTGHVRLTIPSGSEGNTITLRHAEVMEHGELGTRPLRHADCTDVVVLAGTGTPQDPEVFTPTLTQHGFRYVEVEGFDGDDDALAAAVTARVVSAAMERTGWFSSSEPLVDRLVENTRWSTVDNFITVPTDCPQRDERLGWTGDIGAFAPTALSLYDSAAFLDSWCQDMDAAQGEDGGVPVVIPDVLDGPRLTCAWGDAIVLVPWAVWEATGDLAVLERHVGAMARFVDGVAAVAGESRLWRGGFQFGDWLDPDAPPEDPAAAKADADVVATAYLAHSSRLLARTYQALGRSEDARRYHALSDEVRAAYLGAYVTDGGQIISDCATVYAQALAWDLLDTPRRRTGAGDRLADLVRLRGFRISTGFVGTPLVPSALVKGGHADVAARLVLERGCPSWLYPVTMGATTIWERWDSMLPDGSINPGQMTSFNHYALGAVTQWLLDDVAGLASSAPGWREVTVAPQVGHGFTAASATRRTPLGVASVAWELGEADGAAELEVAITVPVGAHATLVAPDGSRERLGHGVHERRLTVPATGGARTPSTIRELIDHEPSWERVTAAMVEGGHPLYVHGGEVALLGFLKRELDAPVSALPAAATMHGFIPGMEPTLAALEKVVAELS